MSKPSEIAKRKKQLGLAGGHSRRGVGPGVATAEYTENIILTRQYRNFIYELEEIDPIRGKWQISVIQEPDGMGDESLKLESFPAFDDPDDADEFIQGQIDEALIEIAEEDLVPPPREPERFEGPGTPLTSEEFLDITQRGRGRARRAAAGVKKRTRRKLSEKAEVVAEQFRRVYDPKRPAHENINRLSSRIQELKDELNLTVDPSWRHKIRNRIDELQDMIRLLSEGKRPKSNPTKEEHKKIGRKFLKQSEVEWDKYVESQKPKDLLKAYECLVLAKQEAKFGKDKAAHDQAKKGVNAARAEIMWFIEND